MTFKTYLQWENALGTAIRYIGMMPFTDSATQIATALEYIGLPSECRIGKVVKKGAFSDDPMEGSDSEVVSRELMLREMDKGFECFEVLVEKLTPKLARSIKEDLERLKLDVIESITIEPRDRLAVLIIRIVRPPAPTA